MSDDEEPESPEEALGLMVGRLHPKKDVQEYLTVLGRREVGTASALKSMGIVLREANSPSPETMKLLGIDPERQDFKIRRYKGTQKMSYIEKTQDGSPPRLIEKQEEMWEEVSATAQEYTKEILKRNRGLAQSLCLLVLSQSLDNYRVAREAVGRQGGIRIATSMITGKQEASMGVLGRFRRALGQRE